MGSSRRFFIALPAGVLLIFGIYLGLFRLQMGAPTESSRWCSEVLQRKYAAAHAISGPRILLVGGSSTHFGLSARLIGEMTGRPAINLGSHAAIGPGYILHRVKQEARPGDTVLLALEYEFFEPAGTGSLGWNDPLYIDYIVSRDPEYFYDLPWSEQFELAMIMPLHRLPRGLKARIRPETRTRRDPAYDLSRLNPQGDETGHTAATRITNASPIYVPIKVLVTGPPPTEAGLAPIDEFCRWARTNGIQVLATSPAIAFQPIYRQKPALRTFERIEEFYRSRQIPVLEPPETMFFPPDDFYDTRYHLVQEQQLARTTRLVPILKAYLRDPAASQSSQAQTPSRQKTPHPLAVPRDGF